MFLEPYPRDFRRGIFKYKSTPGPLAPPTDEDLVRAIRNGSPGSGDAGVQPADRRRIGVAGAYVKYLSIRGEIERALIFDSIDLLDDEYDRLVDLSLRDKDPEEFAEQMAPITAQVRGVVQRWLDAPGQVTPVPSPRADWDSADCHSPRARVVRGQGRQLRQVSRLDGPRRRRERRLRRLGARNRGSAESRRESSRTWLSAPCTRGPARPRNLEYGVYRGGSRPEDLYRRILNGISGTPMPAIPLRPDDAKPDDQRLTADDVWHLVAYVLSLRDGGLVRSDQ